MKKMLSKHSKGQIIVMYAGILAALLGAVAMGTDVAVMYVNWARMQKAADIAVLSGAGNLKQGTSSATSTCTSYLTSNGIDTSTEILSACAVATTTQPNDTVKVSLTRTVPHIFGRAVDVYSGVIQVSAAAQIQPPGGAGGPAGHLIPLGYACAAPCGLVPGDNIVLPGETGGPPGSYKLSPGNWGGLTFPSQNDNGNGKFTDAVTNGYTQGVVYSGTVSGVTSNTGTYVNPSGQAGLLARYNAGTQGPTGPYSSTDPRIIQVPLVASWPGGTKTVDLTGFVSAVLIPDGHGTFYARIADVVLADTVPTAGAPNTGTYRAVLLQ
jgi:hypothetical protein